MSRPSLQFALGGLVLCAIGGFWLGLQGALPRGESASRNAEVSPSLEPAPNAYRTPVDAAPFSDAVTSSDEPPVAESDAPEVEVAAVAPVKRPPVETVVRPAPPPRETAPASATPVVAPPAPAPVVAPPPADDLPPY